MVFISTIFALESSISIKKFTRSAENQMSTLITAISLILFLYLLNQLLQSLNKNKRLPPGPIGLPLLGHFHLLGTNPHENLSRLARKHGPIMSLRLGFVQTIVISSPHAAELVLKSHDDIFANRPALQGSKHVGYDQKGIIFGHYGPYWRNMRKLCTVKLLSQLKINQFRPVRTKEVELLIESIQHSAKTEEVVDLSARVAGLTSDITCLMVFGRKYDNSDVGEKGFKAVIDEAQHLGAAFNLADYFPYIEVLDLQGLTRRMKRLSKIFDGFLERIIRDHVLDKNKTRTQDFTDILVDMLESGEAGFEFDRRHVKAVLFEILVAGSDTSSTTVEWALSELIRHPEKMKKLQEELEMVVGKEHMVEESHLEHLQYLDFVVKETLRLHPPGPLLLPHESMEDCSLDGFHVPKKSRIMVNVWAIGRDPAIWPDPEKFSPERFMTSNVDITGRDFRLIPFGAGRRGCPGLQLGLLVVRLVLSQLVHCFDWKLPDGMSPTKLDMSEHFGFVTCRAKHLLAVPRYRLHK